VTNPRHAVKQAHERYQVGLLLKALNDRHRSRYIVISEPEPPEAIIRSNRTTRWVEVVTVYLNTDFARDLNSFATAGETHQCSSGKLIVGPDEQFSQNFVSVVRAKLEKKTYGEFRDRYGPGYLLVSIQNPLFGSDTLLTISEHWRATSIDDQECFRSIYLTYRAEHGYKIRRWVPPKKSAVSSAEEF
jgi:hypothetical protein